MSEPSPLGPRTTISAVVVAFYAAFLVVLAFFAFNHQLAEHWAYIALYLGAGVYAALNRCWLTAATAASVAVVRAMIALGITGIPFFLASLSFAALFFALVVTIVRSRRQLPS